MSRRVSLLPWLLLALSACSGRSDPEGTDRPETDGGPSSPVDPSTSGETPGPPTRLQVACEPVQALRFSCAVTVEPPQPVQISFARADGLGVERIHASEAAAGEHEIGLYFMAPERAYTVRASATAWPDREEVLEVTTGAPPVTVQSWIDGTGSATVGLIGTNLPCNNDAVAVVYDTTTGDLVWYERLDPNGTLGLLDMVRFSEDRTVLGETDGQIVEVDRMGDPIARLRQGREFDEHLHHDIFERAGRYYALYQVGDLSLALDAVLVLDRSGAELGRWRSDEHLDIPESASGDWLHTNTVYVEPDGGMLLSFLNRSTVAKIDGDLASPTFGQVRWFLAGEGADGLGSDFVVDWSAIAGPEGFGNQHNVHPRHDGRLMLLDNDHGRGLVLTLDEAAGTATVDAEYPAAEGRCGPQGTAMDTASGNALVGCAGDTIREYAPAGGDPLWEGVVDCVEWRGGFLDRGAARWYPLDGW